MNRRSRTRQNDNPTPKVARPQDLVPGTATRATPASINGRGGPSDPAGRVTDPMSTNYTGPDGATTADASRAREMVRQDRQQQAQNDVTRQVQGAVGGRPAPLTPAAWDGAAQQQPREPIVPGLAPPSIPAPGYNPAPTDAAMDGQGTVHREMPTGYMPIADTIVFALSQAADEIPPWGSAPRARDVALRNFWPTEPVLASAVFTMASKYASFGWTLEGPEEVARNVQMMLHGCERGQGWIAMMIKCIIDLFTQDNGCFIEIVRKEDSPLSPVRTLEHMDAGRVIRTGRWEEPIVYIDLWGVHHRMKWYQVMCFAEFPSPIEMARGMQYCAVTRLLKAAQIMRDITIYHQEKMSGRWNKSIWLVGGVQQSVITDSLKLHASDADQRNMLRYIQPAIVASLDPNARITATEVKLAGLPDNFDYDVMMRWYVTQLAMAFGGDYQDFAPLSASNMNSSSGQSQILHLKSRGKGSSLFMRLIEQAFNFHGVMPSMIRFSYGEQDTMANLEQIELQKERAQWLQLLVVSQILSPNGALQVLAQYGDIDDDIIRQMMTVAPTETVAPGGILGGGAMNRGDGTTTSPEKKAPAGKPGAQNPQGSVDRLAEDPTGSRQAGSIASSTAEHVEKLENGGVRISYTPQEDEDTQMAAARLFFSQYKELTAKPQINVTMPEMRPVINVQTPNVVVNVPEQPTPNVNVNVEPSSPTFLPSLVSSNGHGTKELGADEIEFIRDETTNRLVGARRKK